MLTAGWLWLWLWRAVAGWRRLWLGFVADCETLDHREVVAHQGGEEVGEEVVEGKSTVRAVAAIGEAG